MNTLGILWDTKKRDMINRDRIMEENRFFLLLSTLKNWIKIVSIIVSATASRMSWTEMYASTSVKKGTLAEIAQVRDNYKSGGTK